MSPSASVEPSSSDQSSGIPDEPTPLSSDEEEAPIEVTEAEVVTTLTHGEMQPQGLLPYSSNHSFLVTVENDEMALPAVYKPRRGENPLWDFEWGTLCLRETAAYTISAALGWNLVPPTVLREGTHGIGSVQLYIANDDSEHYFTVQDDARFADVIRRLALFDFVINNADRKSGHCLIGDDGRMWAIDHGIAFHTEYKLRTVIWELSNEPIDDDLMADLSALNDELADLKSKTATVLCQLLTADEYRAMTQRLDILIHTGKFPAPSGHRRNYPWPPI